MRPKDEYNLGVRIFFGVFVKLTRACFSQIALETILLPILIEKHILKLTSKRRLHQR